MVGSRSIREATYPGIALGYPSTGTLTSSILDVNNYPHWQEVQWQDSVPAGSSLRFRVRSSNDPEDMGEWSGYIEEPGSLVGVC